MARCILPLVVFVIIGCRLPADREIARPLAENGMLYSYTDLIVRARAQASVATEAFYIDSWIEVEEAAKGLEQTAKFLPRSVDQPLRLKDSIVQQADVMAKESVRLANAARSKDVVVANESLQHINMQIRVLRPGE